MPSKIKILSEPLINRIAAGEVVERPSSIVKELIDNSIDAQSHDIVIRLKEGGKGFISISDNGEGMTPEDAILAFERHATSKLSSVEDLDSIKTLGFRGEALPSIAAVSSIHLTTRTQEDRGIELDLFEGKVSRQAEIGRAPGTEISVSRLFENFPARKKFLRSGSTELAQVVSIINQLALVHFKISFELIHHDKRIFRYPSVENSRDRIYQIYGGEILEKMVPVTKGDNPDFRIKGFVSLPPHSCGNRSFQELFVNQRPIKNIMINHAVYEAFSSHIMKGQHPAYFLFIESDPARVDVNVHPSKKEVRFSDSSSIHQIIYRTIKESIIPTGISPGMAVVTGKKEFKFQEGVEDHSFKAKDAVQAYAIRPVSGEKASSPEDRDLFNKGEFLQEPFFRVLGQFQSMFFLIQSEGDLMIIDQHAAHERVLFEKYLNRSLMESGQSQTLLIPQPVEMNLKEILILKEFQESFAEIGIEFEFFGEKTLLIRSVPEFLIRSDLKLLLIDLIEEIEHFQGLFSEKEKLEKMIATLACHAAIKAGQSLGHSEISALFKELSKLNFPSTCPHGRPISRTFTLKDLEKMFCRI